MFDVYAKMLTHAIEYGNALDHATILVVCLGVLGVALAAAYRLLCFAWGGLLEPLWKATVPGLGLGISIVLTLWLAHALLSDGALAELAQLRRESVMWR